MSKKAGGKKRTAASMSLGAASVNPGVNNESREDKAHGITRHNRVPLGGASKSLSIAVSVQERMDKENKHLHWVLDNDKGQLQRALNGGYEHVIDEAGGNIYRNSGGRNQYLMAIPNEWHEDDKLLKRKRATASLGTEAALGDNEYSPNNQESAVSSTESDNPYSS